MRISCDYVAWLRVQRLVLVLICFSFVSLYLIQYVSIVQRMLNGGKRNIIPSVLIVKINLKLNKRDVATRYSCIQLSKYVHNSVHM